MQIDLAFTNEDAVRSRGSLVADRTLAITYLGIAEAADEVFRHEALGEAA